MISVYDNFQFHTKPQNNLFNIFSLQKKKKDFVEKSFLKKHNWKTFNGLKIVTTQNIIIESMDDHASIHLIERFVGSYLKSFA